MEDARSTPTVGPLPGKQLAAPRRFRLARGTHPDATEARSADPPHFAAPPAPAVRRADDTVRSALFPVMGGPTLRDLVREAKANEAAFQARGRTVLRSAYSG